MEIAVYGCKTTFNGIKKLASFIKANCFCFTDETLKNYEKNIASANYIILSPGITKDKINNLKQVNSNILSEIDFAFKFFKNKPVWAGITGSKGKTSTVDMTAKALNIPAAGNIGITFAEIIPNNPINAILELSSFQLEQTKNLELKIGVILNLTQDHLDRYNSLEEYFLTKAVGMRNLSQNLLILHENKDFFEKNKIKFEYTFSSKNKEANFYIDKENNIFFNGKFIEKINNKNCFGFRKENFLAAASILILLNERNKIKNLDNYQFKAHRLEFIREINGIKFYNDSKSTSVASTIAAVKSFPLNKVILLIGGWNKNLDWQPILNLPIKKFVCFGDIKNILHNLNKKNSITAKNLKEAVLSAVEIAKPGDIILLSPATSSFDEFSSYEERGDFFKEVVNNL